ncbi:hypothetical protein Tco_0492361 [Tanacetum coccineum]
MSLLMHCLGCSLPQGQAVKGSYTWANQELRRKGKLVVSNDQPLRTGLLQQFHEGAVGGHSGVKTTRESKVEAVDRTLSAREEAIEVCKLADKKRTNREFQVGYWIQDRVGQVSYRLKLPTSAQIHNIFRISQLKKCRSPVTQCGTLTACNPNGVLLMEPVAILDRRMSKKRNAATVFVLIQWANGSEEDAT